MSALGDLWSLRRERPLLVATSLVVLAGLLAFPILEWYLRVVAGPTFGWVPPFHFNDFGSYATAAARWFEGETIYWRNSGGTFYATYLYPPVYLPVFVPWLELGGSIPFDPVPLAGSPAELAALLWGVFTVGLLWVGLQLAARECGLALAWSDRVLALWGLVGFQPLLFSVKLGQVSAFVAATFCFAFVAMERGNRAGANRWIAVLSGVLTTLASGIKLYYATAGAHLLRDRDRFLGAIGAGLGLAGLSVLVFGVGNNLAYLEVLAWGKGWGADPKALYLWHPGYYEPMYTVAAWVPSATVVVRAALVLGVASLAFLARDADAERATFALGLVVYPLAAPVAYTQDFVALLLAAGVLVAVEFDRPGGRPWLPVAAIGLLAVHAYGWRLVVYHLSGGPPFGGFHETFMPLFQPGLIGNVVLLGVSAAAVVSATDLGDRIPATPGGDP